MARIAQAQELVFTPFKKPVYLIHGSRWVDFYVLLGLERAATRAEVEEAIVSCGADLLALTFARGGGSEWTVALRRYYLDFRPVLLQSALRLEYDALLLRHESGDLTAPDYDAWRAVHLKVAATAKLVWSWKRGASSLRSRLLSSLWESEFI